MKCKICIFTFLIVITDPYKGIDYSKPNTYQISDRCKKDCVQVIEAQKEADTEHSEEYTESESTDNNSDLLFYFPWLQSSDIL